MKRTYRLMSLMLLAVMLVTACGGGAQATEPMEETPAGVVETPMEATATTGAVTSPTTAPTEPMADTPAATSEATAAPTMGAGAGMIDCLDAQPGDELTLMYQWSGSEEELFNSILEPFIEACGVEIISNSNRDAAVLDAAVQSTPPDILIWPTIEPLALYSDQLLPLGDLMAEQANYADFWVDIGTVDGEWLAVPVKADIKSIVWYSPAQFEAFGYEVPTTFEGLEDLVEQMVADGNVPWSMGMENGANTGWTGSDFIQDMLLTMQGPEYVMGIIDGSVPYNDPGVVDAYEDYARWASDPAYTVGGADGTVNTPFLDAIFQVFSDPPDAMMVKQSGFAGEEIVKEFPTLTYGTDFDFFVFPGIQGMQGGADFLMAFSDSPAAQALIAYLTGATGAETWATVGFALSPNTLAEGMYADEQLSKKAEFLAQATGFTPDLGDSIPPPFGETEWGAIITAVQGGDIETALDEVAAVQAQVLGR